MVDNGPSSVVRKLRKPEDWFTRVQELTSLVLAEAALVNAFKGRWMVITNRSQQLSTCTSAVANLSCFQQSSLFKELLPNIVHTLEEGREFARRCTDLNYGGKLLMQSNLDALTTKLDLHLRDSELLLKSGVLRETAVAANSHREISSEAKREAATLLVWDLFARLKIGNTELKKIALDSLVDFLKKEEKRIVLVVEEGDIPYLIHLLDSSLAAIREKAATAVSILAQADVCRQSLTIENAHAPLIRLLETGTPVAKEKAVEALLGLSYIRENAYSIAALGGVAVLVELCRNGTPGARAISAGTIRNLAGNEEIRKCLAEEDAIPVLINLITCGTPLAQEYSAEALQNLASGDDRFRLVIARHGGLQTLVMYLQRSTSPKAQEIAIRALRNLSACATNAKNLISTGYLSQLATILNTGSSSVQQLAASAICNLSSCLDIRKALGDAGCIPPLAWMLEAKNIAEQETATQALSNLVLHSNNAKEFCKEEKGISRLAQVLDPRNRNIAKRFPMSALLALSNSNNRKRILSAGARQQLEKLAEMDVPVVKKTLEKFGGNKLRNIFRRHRS